MNTLRVLLSSALAFLPLAEASAGTSTITTTDQGGVTRTFVVTTDAGGNFVAQSTLCDGAAAVRCASVGVAGTPSTNALTIQAITLGSGTAANAMRVELANNGTGVLATVGAVTSITNPVTITGTVTAVTSITNAVTVAGGAASGAALAGNPVRVGLSDGTNAQNWLAGIALADGVNGNNTGAVAGYVWNGTTWDRMPGTTAGVTVRNPTAANLNATVTATNLSTNVSQINAVTPLMGNGATGTGSLRVTISNDNTFPTGWGASTLASGSVASGAYSSGAFASGAFASGSVSSGAFASGSLAAGAMVDFLTVRQTVAAGTAASNSLLAGGVYNSTPITLTNTQGAALQFDANGYLKVNTAAGAAAGGTSSNFGSAFPTPGTAVGFTDGTNMVAARVGAIANVAAATNMVNTILGCQYNATPLTVTDTRYQSLQCDVAGNARVTVTNANTNGQATMANSSPVVIASNQSNLTVIGAGTAGTANSGVVTVQGIASMTALSVAGTGTAGTANAGVVTVQGIASMTPLSVTLAAAATGGSSTTGNIAANNTTAVVVKASAGTVYGVQVYGIGSAPAYLKIYNATSATCGSGTPVKRLMIPAAGTAANGAGSNITFDRGVAFGTGITYCVTTGIADNDTTAPAASTFLVNLDWL